MTFTGKKSKRYPKGTPKVIGYSRREKPSTFGKPESEDGVKFFQLTPTALKTIKGTHGFGSWKLKCTGCGKEFTEADIGGMVVSTPRDKPRKDIDLPIKKMKGCKRAVACSCCREYFVSCFPRMRR